MKRYLKYLFILITLMCSVNSFAQDTKKLLKTADDAFDRADFMKAFNLYSEILKKDTGNYELIYKSGVCLFGMNKMDTTCIPYFVKSASHVPEAHYYLGRAYQLRGWTKRAIDELYTFKKSNDEVGIESTEVINLIKNCETALALESQQENYIVKNLGPHINSKYPEYVPLIWKMNGSLVFTSRRENSKGGMKDPYGRYYEDIYIAQHGTDDWQNPISFSEDVNSTTHDACVAFSPDGTELIIYRTDEKQTGGDLYLSKYDGTKWSTPVKMGPEINSEYLEASACFSADGDEIIFSSNRPGGLGGKDLYRVRKFMNGKYSLPFNLGPAINTPLDEDAPYIDPRDNSLYFSSKGHNSMGEYDIFKSVYNTETNRWMRPDNLGVPINSTNDDIYFMKLDDKETAYFTSRREGGYGDADIYEINFDESTQLVIYCRIKYSGLEKGELKDLQLSMYNTENGRLEGVFRPNKNYMTMVLVAALNKPYKLIIESPNTEPVIKNIVFESTTKEIEIEVSRKLK
jgi:hypothetical protein